jgi:hypothetical protein
MISSVTERHCRGSDCKFRRHIDVLRFCKRPHEMYTVPDRPRETSA